MTYALVYVSRATPPMSPLQLRELLTYCRGRNADLGLTGILLYGDGNILQLLEGDVAQVQALYEAIRKDDRHRDVEPVWVGYSPQRLFTTWSMAFRDLDQQPIDDPAYSNVLTSTEDAMTLLRDPTAVRDLLELVRAPTG